MPHLTSPSSDPSPGAPDRPPERSSDRREEDQRIFMRGVTWSEYETLLAVRGERAGIRIAYLEGDLEIISPSLDHETIKKTIARLVEAYADERGLELNGYGSWTIKSAPKERGVEPDECYVLGTERQAAPDLAIEVVWTSGGLDKLEIYRGLGVREVWVWRAGEIEVYELAGDHYARISTSGLLPELDLALLSGLLERESQSQAVRELRSILRGA